MPSNPPPAQPGCSHCALHTNQLASASADHTLPPPKTRDRPPRAPAPQRYSPVFTLSDPHTQTQVIKCSISLQLSAPKTPPLLLPFFTYVEKSLFNQRLERNWTALRIMIFLPPAMTHLGILLRCSHLRYNSILEKHKQKDKFIRENCAPNKSKLFDVTVRFF